MRYGVICKIFSRLKTLKNSFQLQFGFGLNNDCNVIGPMVIFPRTVLAWNVDTVQDITENSLRLFIAMEPKPELLIIGTGDELVTREMTTRIFEILKPHRISFEVLKTDQVRRRMILHYIPMK